MRLLTVPLGPSGGSARPFSSSETPPALPSVSTNGRFETHSRIWPAGTVSSVLLPSSVRTRIQVGSDTRATRRYGEATPPVAACTLGSQGGGAAAREASAVTATPAVAGAEVVPDVAGPGVAAGPGGVLDAGSGVGRDAGALAAVSDGAGSGARRSTRSSRAGCVMSATANNAMPRITSSTKLTRTALRLRASPSVAATGIDKEVAGRGGAGTPPSRP